jgi:hypothetical protein
MAAQKLEKLVFPEKLLQKNTGADALHKKLKVSRLGLQGHHSLRRANSPNLVPGLA